jgi:hypothetical protein
VRAIDLNGNVDLTPAGYSFEVVLAGSPLTPPGPAPAATPTPAPKPNTTISGKPGARTHDRTPTFRFGSNRTGAGFQCKLDRKPFRTCSSPFTTRKLPYGKHMLRVRAILAGAVDPSPARLTFKVVRNRK